MHTCTFYFYIIFITCVHLFTFLQIWAHKCHWNHTLQRETSVNDGGVYFLDVNLGTVVFTLFLSVCVCRLRGGGMVSPQLVTTLGRRWRPGREERGSAWAGRVPGRWSSIRTPRVSVSRYATSSFTLQSPPCTPTSR